MSELIREDGTKLFVVRFHCANWRRATGGILVWASDSVAAELKARRHLSLPRWASQPDVRPADVERDFKDMIISGFVRVVCK